MKSAALETARRFERNLVSRSYIEKLTGMLPDRKQDKRLFDSTGG